MKRRKTVSVMPAMGASTVAGRISTVPKSYRRGDAGVRGGGALGRIVEKLGHVTILTALYAIPKRVRTLAG